MPHLAEMAKIPAHGPGATISAVAPPRTLRVSGRMNAAQVNCHAAKWIRVGQCASLAVCMCVHAMHTKSPQATISHSF